MREKLTWSLSGIFRLLEHGFSMDVRIYNLWVPSFSQNNLSFVQNNLTEYEVLTTHFSSLKEIGFSFDPGTFDETGKFKGDNYGNYDLNRIEFDDFKRLDKGKESKAVKEYLDKTIQGFQPKVSILDQEEYIDTDMAALRFQLKGPKYAYELDIDSLKQSDKHHQFYSLWDHFKSYIFFFNNSDPSRLIYMEIGYD